MPATQSPSQISSVTVRFAGDSGDGMQVTGEQFSSTTALMGNDFATFPDFPAEIRAPAGSIPGVSSFQIQFSDSIIFTPGDTPDVLVAMNPAALKAHYQDVTKGGLILVNEDGFTKGNLKKAEWEANPLKDDTLSGFTVIRATLTSLTSNALTEIDITKGEKERCKNFFEIGRASCRESV